MDATTHAQRRHEADALGSMVTRVLRALARRAQEGDEVALEELTRLEGVMREQLGSAVVGYKATGHSWADVAQVLGGTRQAAQQRFANADPAAAHGPRCRCGLNTCPRKAES